MLQEGMPGNPIDLDDEEEGEEYAQDDLDQEEDVDGLEYADEGAAPRHPPYQAWRKVLWLMRWCHQAWVWMRCLATDLFLQDAARF